MRLIPINHILLTALSAIVAVAAVDANFHRSYRVYHQLGSNGSFTEKFTYVLTAPDPPPDDDRGSDAFVGSFAGPPSNAIAATAFDAMLLDGGNYTVRVVDEEDGKSLDAGVPGCDLHRANYR